MSIVAKFLIVICWKTGAAGYCYRATAMSHTDSTIIYWNLTIFSICCITQYMHSYVTKLSIDTSCYMTRDWEVS